MPHAGSSRAAVKSPGDSGRMEFISTNTGNASAFLRKRVSSETAWLECQSLSTV
jgi:hypothetical protein